MGTSKRDDSIAPRGAWEFMSSEAGQKISKYFFILWGVCVVAGAVTAIGLASAGMDVNSAFYSGIAFASLPVVVAIIFFVVE